MGDTAMLENEEIDDETATDEDVDTTDSEEQDDAGADQLGDAGKKALERMKAQTKELRAEVAELRALAGDKRGLDTIKAKATAQIREQMAELQAKLSGREAEYAAEKKAREAEQAALGKANERILRSEVRAAATGKLANPAIALRLLDLSSFDVNEDGEVDASAISDALDELLKKEPYLALTQGESKRFQGTGDQGPKGSAGKPPQVTEAQLKTMTPDQIVTAQKEGRLKDLLGG